MKFLLFVSLFSQLAMFSHAQASDIGKTFDGTSARCQDLIDIGNSAYRLKIFSEKQSGSTREILFDVNFLKCEASKNGGVGLVPAAGNEILNQRILTQNSEAIVEHKILSFSLTAFTESGKLFDKVLIGDLSQTRARVRISIDENKLDKGETILINGLGVESTKLATDSEDKAMINEFISGTYSIHLN